MVPCWTSREPGALVERHPVTITADWTVTTPHDIEGERIAAAFGGFVSCVDLVDTAVPAARVWTRRLMRTDLPELEFAGDADRWRVRDAAACCPRSGFRDAVNAAEHWRSPRHVAAASGAIGRQVTVLAAAVRRAHDRAGMLGIPADDQAAAAECCLRGDLDVAWLWDAGIHPRVVHEIHAEVGVGSPMPARFYLGVAWNRPDLSWVADTLAGRDDPQEVAMAEYATAQDATREGMRPDSLATWLAWSAANWDTVHPRDRARWIDSGISRSLILALGEAGYDPDEVVAYARAVDRSPEWAARNLRSWVDAGFHPWPSDLVALVSTGIPAGIVPPRAAVARLRARVDATDAVWSDTDFALVLAEYGTVMHAAVALREGARPCRAS